MSQSFTFIDLVGNRAQYTVFDKDRDNNFRWSTDHGDHGVNATLEQAQYRARTVLKDHMAAARRSDEKAEAARVLNISQRWRSH